jgi:tRNA modification GTPase
MKFVHHFERQDSTIAAISTPLGEGGIAVIRISGIKALEIADKLSSLPLKKANSHQAYYGKILSKGNVLDSALFLPMLNGRSYTGEETVEIHCHGGFLVSQKVLDLVIETGARPAGPGEFTLRAYMNGKIDLAQAEAVQEVIFAKNEYALKASEQQLEGGLSRKIKLLQKELTDLVAILEAWVDFPEDGLEYMSMEQMEKGLAAIIDSVRELALSYHEGRVVKDGICLCLLGCPNVGKSSLMNALLDKERAIVTEIAGTTRDTLEEDLIINGLNFKLLDTAGVRETQELIEAEGIKRTFAALKQADLILWVLDKTKGFQEEDELILKKVDPLKTIIVWNKEDLENCKIVEKAGFKHVCLSAKTGIGLESLKQQINTIIWEDGTPPAQEQILVTQARHKEALNRAEECLSRGLKALLNGESAELISCDGKQGLKELGSVIGLDVSEEVLGAIFSKFCIGK